MKNFILTITPALIMLMISNKSMKNFKLTCDAIFILFFTSLFIFSCKDNTPCPDASTTNVDFNSNQIIFSPYEGNDTIKFTNDKGDTLEYISEPKQFFYTSKSVRESNPDCNVYHTTNYQSYTLLFNNSQNPTISFTYSLTEPAFNVEYKDCKFVYSLSSIVAGRKNRTINNIVYGGVAEIITNRKDTLWCNRGNGILMIYNAVQDERLSIIK